MWLLWLMTPQWLMTLLWLVTPGAAAVRSSKITTAHHRPALPIAASPSHKHASPLPSPILAPCSARGTRSLPLAAHPARPECAMAETLSSNIVNYLGAPALYHNPSLLSVLSSPPHSAPNNKLQYGAISRRLASEMPPYSSRAAGCATRTRCPLPPMSNHTHSSACCRMAWDLISCRPRHAM